MDNSLFCSRFCPLFEARKTKRDGAINAPCTKISISIFSKSVPPSSSIVQRKLPS
jgi:hypothetical protein